MKGKREIMMGVEKKVYSFRLDTDMVNQLQRCAEQENRTLSNLVQTVLKRYLMEKQKNKEWAEKK